ncbi:MAG: transcriptional regulator [Snowella sp.]|jgi:transcriptional regulator with XRE-family HTH domain|nr:MAG: transcriptional regulator [Snowella sp.]
MTLNNHEGSDVFDYFQEVLPETPETHLIECQELFRIDLTQAMRNLRKATGLTQKEVAEKLGVTQSWVSKLESANNDHTFESVLAYLDALGADFEALIYWQGKEFTRVSTELKLMDENELQISEDQTESSLNLVPIESQNKSSTVNNIIRKQGFWGAIAA